MGVMSCSRSNCNNIMCDTYIDGGIGYICNECQSEFKDLFKIESPTESEIRASLKIFMETFKDNHKDKIDVNDFFKSFKQ